MRAPTATEVLISRCSKRWRYTDPSRAPPLSVAGPAVRVTGRASAGRVRRRERQRDRADPPRGVGLERRGPLAGTGGSAALAAGPGTGRLARGIAARRRRVAHRDERPAARARDGRAAGPRARP